MSDPRSTAPPRSTVLRPRQEQLGAVFVDFGDWQLPVRYTSDLAEHLAVREAAGLFDVSHMAEFLVHQGEAAAFLDYALAVDASSMPIGRASYSFVLAPDGGILDDVIVYRTGDASFLVIANADNRDAVSVALTHRLGDWAAARPEPHEHRTGDFAAVVGGGVPRVEDVSDQFSLLALQGPRAAEILTATSGVELVEPPVRRGDAPRAWAVDDLGYYRIRGASFEGDALAIARTGYTGEDGFELLVPNRHAVALWDALLDAGEPLGLVPAGLAARDTLRLEAGMPLYGHELDAATRPEQAGLGRAVAASKTDFVGGEALREPLAAEAPVLVGLAGEGRRAARAGYPVYDGDSVVGRITSGALSPTLGHPIALAYVDPASAAPGTSLDVDVRGTRIPASVTPLPFYRRKR